MKKLKISNSKKKKFFFGKKNFFFQNFKIKFLKSLSYLKGILLMTFFYCVNIGKKVSWFQLFVYFFSKKCLIPLSISIFERISNKCCKFSCQLKLSQKFPILKKIGNFFFKLDRALKIWFLKSSLNLKAILLITLFCGTNIGKKVSWFQLFVYFFSKNRLMSFWNSIFKIISFK